jgi:hypothetical protein
LWNQAELENWIGTPPAAPLSEGLNVYLFSTMGNLQGATLRTVDRATIILWASGAALVCGLMLIYWPAVRHPVVLLLLAAALATVGLLNPEPVLLIAQASILGVLLSGAVAMWERCFTSRRKTPLVAEAPSVASGRGSTRVPTPLAGGVAGLPATQNVSAFGSVPPTAPSPKESPP